MGRPLTRREFYELVAKKSNTNKETIEKIWINVLEIILDELIVQGTMQLPYIGTFKARAGGGITKKCPEFIGVKDSPMVDRYINPFLLVQFKRAESFHERLNGREVSPAFKMQQRIAYKKMLKEQEEIPRIIDIEERKEKAWKELIEKRKLKDLKKMKMSKMTEKQKREFLDSEQNYWDDFTDEIDTELDSKDVSLEDVMD